MTLFIFKSIFLTTIFALYNKVDIITFLKKSYACNFQKVASV